MKQKIAVLGGGMGSLSAVFALTSTPGWQERYEITVYQQGWRLGGKGASGRNRKQGNRIEEHGFHIWMGFYHNAFRTMREAYDERLRVVSRSRGVSHVAGCLDAAAAERPHRAHRRSVQAVADYLRRPARRSQHRPGASHPVGTSADDSSVAARSRAGDSRRPGPRPHGR